MHAMRHLVMSRWTPKPSTPDSSRGTSALSAIPRLLQAVSLLHERRAGRSDRAADFRRLALWFAAAGGDANSHRLWRAGFALSPARHLALAVADEKVSANTTWRDSPGIAGFPKIRDPGGLP